MNITILGGGMIGKAIALDLAADIDCIVTVVDNSDNALEFFRNRNIRTEKIDLTSMGVLTGLSGINKAIYDQDLIINALPDNIGFHVVRPCLEAGKDMVDICFYSEDPFQFDELAKSTGSTYLVDFGIAPGCSNLLFGHMLYTMHQLQHFECYVGGLPLHPEPPWNYKAPFSPQTVIQEYIRPARCVVNGKIEEKSALSELEIEQFPIVGKLEAFLTDGLRTLLRFKDQVPSMVEKTYRYPGHRDLALALRESGFFSEEPLNKSTTVRPIDLSTQLLAKAWKYEGGEEDLTLMKVKGIGFDEFGSGKKLMWYLIDNYDKKRNISSMARTTGYTATAAARLLKAKKFVAPGVFAPEDIGQDPDCFSFIMKELADRNIIFQKWRE